VSTHDRNEMVEANLGLVHSVARGYSSLGVPYEDLVQEGTIGLMRAVERFDDSRGVKFSTYAVWWIRSRIVKALGQARTIRVPPRADLRGAARVTASLDEQIGEDGSLLADLVADPDPVDPVEELDRQETREQVSWMLELLPERHRVVVARRYGLAGEEAQTHARIGAALGVGEERSRQLEREALHRLRELRLAA
jgi:RNA polymerase primary sigma factor